MTTWLYVIIAVLLRKIMKKQSLLGRFLIWRVKHINDRTFLMILSVIIGLGTGMAAVIIKNSVHLIQSLLTNRFTIEYQNYLYFAYPMIGIFIAVLFIKFVIKGYVGHGIPSVLYAISKDNGIMKRHNMFSSIFTSAFTVGFGGSVGLEGPTVATGAAIGSNLGQALRLNYRQICLLMAVASAGAMSAIFKSPIAAVVFAIEVIMIDMTLASIVPLLIASATAALTSYMFLGDNVLYTFILEEKFLIRDIPYFSGLGVLTGLISVYFTRMYMSVGGVFERFKKWYVKLIIGGSALGLIIFIFPTLFGEGYEAINLSLQGNISALFDKSLFYDYRNNFTVVIILLSLIVLFKVIAASITFGSGGIGGIFAPTLFMGTYTGLLFAKVFNFFGFNLSESNFALVGMGGLIAGVLHAPLTAIFLIAEITNGYGLFFPLMITATISYVTIRIFETNNVYSIQLAKRGELLTHHKDKAVLKLMKVNRLIETDFTTIGPDACLRDLVGIVSKSQRNIFPVVTEDNTFQGIITLDNIRHIMFKPDKYDEVKVTTLMFMPTTFVEPDESMEEVAQKFSDTGKFNLPVLKNGKYIGFISRAKVFSEYRKMLKHFSED